MNLELNELVQQHLKFPGDITLIDRIIGLNPTDHDFCDEFLDSCEPGARLQIYLMVLICCGLHAETVLKRRIEVENDEQCKTAAQVMLGWHLRGRGVGERALAPNPSTLEVRPLPDSCAERRVGIDSMLKTLVLQYLEHPGDFVAARRIKGLAPTDWDFTDEFFDSFDPEARLQIYPMLLMWCRLSLEKILNRRLMVETDKSCKLAADMMLRCLRSNQEGGQRITTLKALVRQHVERPGSFMATERIKLLAPTDCDFSDDFFDSFEADARLQIYKMLNQWAAAFLKGILERRVKVEVDNHCRLAAESMLREHQRGLSELPISED